MSTRTEEPSYVVIRTLEQGIEIREYDSQIRATSQMGQENRSFGVLAEYVFGHNDQNERIGMTAPVITDRDKMSFIMPKDPFEFIDLLARGDMLSLQRNRLLEEMAKRLRSGRDDA